MRSEISDRIFLDIYLILNYLIPINSTSKTNEV
jgi:hypothetical protein